MGAEEARLFVREGARVVIADVLEEEGKRLEAELQASGGEALFVRTDVTSEDDWRHTVQATVARFGKLDILVNNAGLSSTSVPDLMDTDGWRRIGKPIEVAYGVLFLASDEASFITGTELVIDGGFIAR
jgi:NAD(P)-dependent dehydrogenase (short-subunit alcohol dehydrogenase family)